MKKEVRIIAWDDCAFHANARRVLLVGAIFRGAECMDGLLSTRIKKDGLDATEKITDAINSSRHHDQLSYVMLNGITFAGFNMTDIPELNEKTGLPVVAVLRAKPEIEKFMQAMKKLPGFAMRKKIVDRAGEIQKYGEIFYQSCGMHADECEELLGLTSTRSNVPEPLRIAHIIASGLSRKNRNDNGFESRGRA